jgi:hypothetical protein
VAQLAARQHETVAVRQLVSLGLSASAVRSRVARGRLHVVFRGVVSLASPRSFDGEGTGHGGDTGVPTRDGGVASFFIDAVRAAPGDAGLG